MTSVGVELMGTCYAVTSVGVESRSRCDGVTSEVVAMSLARCKRRSKKAPLRFASPSSPSLRLSEVVATL